MTNLPETLRIGGIDFSVEEVENLRDGSTGLNGWIRINDCQIRIEAGLSPQMKLTVLWHEAVHGLLEQSGFNGDHDERLVRALGYGIVQALRDNPYLRGE